MTDTKDVAYIRERLCKASDVLDEIFVKTKKLSEENKKLKELLKECWGLLNRATVDGAEPNTAELIEILTKIDEVLK